MIGAIIGDIVGSVYEWSNIKTKEFQFFADNCFYTDDSILSIALADSILTGRPYVENLKEFFNAYPNGGYGGGFRRWAQSGSKEPYTSFGNGAAMRISAVGYAFNDLDVVLAKAKEFTEPTHNHPEGIKGAQATATAILLARNGMSKDDIRYYITNRFGYDLNTNCDVIRPTYKFNETCQGTVPQAIVAFLDSTDFEDAIRNAISLGGDSDTMACITGGIAQAAYGVPEWMRERMYKVLDERLGNIVRKFESFVAGEAIPITA